MEKLVGDGRARLPPRQEPVILRLHNVSLPPDATRTALRAACARRLGVEEPRFRSFRVRRVSLDARRKPSIFAVYTVDVDIEGPVPPDADANPAPPDPPDPFRDPPRGRERLGGPVFVVGVGFVGLAASWALARLGYRPRVLERGKPVLEREQDLAGFWREGHLDPESNILFGEGGAGAFSDGKLRTRIGDPLLRTFLELLVEAGAPPGVRIEAAPHLGTDGVRQVAAGMRRLAEGHGASFAFSRHFEGLATSQGRVCGVRVSGRRDEAGAVILALGGSARDTFEALFSEGVAMERKPFQLGLRIEHPQAFLDRMQYSAGVDRWDLPPASYHFSVRVPVPFRSVFTFCMCPGGRIVPAVAEAEHLCTNGMSESSRGGPKGNAALMVTVPPDLEGGGPLSGVALQRRVEREGYRLGGGGFTAPAQRAASYVRGGSPGKVPPTSYPFGVRGADLAAMLPAGVGDAIRAALVKIEKRASGFASDPAVLLGPESRGSSPVRFPRDASTLESISHGGLYPAGEGSGYAGGIASAGVDGLRAALALAARFAPPA